MTDPGREEPQDLAEVKAQFREAEQRLRELAQGAVELTRASVMLKKARMGISDGADGLRQLSERLTQYIDSMAELTGTLAKTSAAVESLDSGEIQQRLERMEERIGAIHESLSAESGAGASRFDAGGLGSDTAQRFESAVPADEATHGKLDRLGEQLAALSAAIEDLRDRASEPGEPAAASASATDTALASLEGRLTAMHGAVESLQHIAQEQLSAQHAVQDSIQSSARQALTSEPVPSAHEEAVAAKLDIVERGLAAIHQTIVRVEDNAARTSSQPEPRSEPGAGAEVGQKLDALAEHFDAVQQTIQAAATEAAAAASGEHTGEAPARLDALDARLAAIQERLEGVSRVEQRSAAEGVQLGLYPDIENTLGTISNDLRMMEAVNVDMVAELRRSLGLEITRQNNQLIQALNTERTMAQSDVEGLRRTVRWLLVGTVTLLAGVLYLIFA